MPDLDALEIPVSITAPIGAQNAREGSAANELSTRKTQLRAARVSKRLPPNPRSTPTQQNTATRVSKRLPANPQSTSTKTKAKQVRSHQPHRTPRQCRATTWRTAHHTPQPPRKRRTKGVQLFRNPLKPAHSPLSRQGSAGQGSVHPGAGLVVANLVQPSLAGIARSIATPLQ